MNLEHKIRHVIKQLCETRHWYIRVNLSTFIHVNVIHAAICSPKAGVEHPFLFKIINGSVRECHNKIK